MLFCDLSDKELDKLSEERGDNFYKKGQVIFYEGNRGHGLYCIYQGKVKVHKLGEEAREQIVRFAKEGDVLGYRSLLGGEPFNATATAMEDSIICYIPRSKFLEVLENNTEFSLKVIRMLAKDLRESEKKLIHITQKPVVERIAEALLILKEKFGLKEDGKTLDVILTRREIGDLAGVTTETTIRTLSELNKKHVLLLNGKRIELVDIPNLLRLANLCD
ncbi:MAG: Crp/Fnr family transcriptional regulator [Flavobacteriales bacterium]|nr:Crp/Fnr family transcriptional regulator [Flavobacteriales bacterium]MCB9447312.1 Crp/Fnr family transcriptional regulator [Flavobacteriales bacterium]